MGRTDIDISKLGEKTKDWSAGDFVIIGRGSGVNYSSIVSRVVFTGEMYMLIDMATGEAVITASVWEPLKDTTLDNLQRMVKSHYSIFKHYRRKDVKITLQNVD